MSMQGGVAAVAVVASLLMAAALVRGITRPINAAVRMAEAIAECRRPPLTSSGIGCICPPRT
jgi:hypothetical protein